MHYFIYTLVQGFRLYWKATFFLTAFSLFYLLPFSFAFFELGLSDVCIDCCFWLVFEAFGFRENAISLLLLYSLLLSIVYIPSSIWIACCTAICLSISNGYSPNFVKITRVALAHSGSILASRIIAQCIILVPVVIMAWFTSEFGHILPMYGKVIIPAIAYFHLYLWLRYSLVETIVVAEDSNPIRALRLCNQVTNGATLRIFAMQQLYLGGFLVMNYGCYVLLNALLDFPSSTINWITTTIMSSINSFYIVTTYYIYLSMAVGEPYSRIQEVVERYFGNQTENAHTPRA